MMFRSLDQRSWSYVFEEEFYHPVLVRRIKVLRREIRNEDEADKFIAECNLRKMRICVGMWKVFIRRRILLRNCLIGAEIRSTLANTGQLFDQWKKLTMSTVCCAIIQRVARGSIVRQRARFIKRLKKKVVMIQSHTRQYMIKKSVDRVLTRNRWAATVIQRHFRGRQARRRIATMVEALHDTEKRKLIRQRQEYWEARRVRAIIRVQVIVRKFLRRRRMMKKLELREKTEYIQELMRKHEEKNELAISIFKQQLSKWYKLRKEEYDENVINAKSTALQRHKIMAKRNKAILAEKERKRIERERQLQKVEEERVEMWIKQWELKIEQRGDAFRKKCQNCMITPETPEEIELKKKLQKSVKTHIKEVLRIADKQKIPMEIPEAYQIALKEMIEKEVVEEKERAKLEMKEEARQAEEEEQEKARKAEEKLKLDRKRKQKWAAVTLQVYARVYFANKRVREKALARYTKSFDPYYHEYYYQDKKTHVTFWGKPKSLGSWDLLMDDYWIVLHCNSNYYYHGANPSAALVAKSAATAAQQGQSSGFDTLKLFYYYNPSTWEQTWTQPRGTVLCEICHEEFAKIYFKPSNYTPSYQRLMITNGSAVDEQYPNYYYCNQCFHLYAQRLIDEYQMKSKDILFQPFHGGKPTADYVDFSFIPFTNWFSYCLELDPTMKLSEEEEEEVKMREEAEKLKKLAPFCQNCLTIPKKYFCMECELHYCKACVKSYHKAYYRYHTFTDLDGNEVDIKLSPVKKEKENVPAITDGTAWGEQQPQEEPKKQKEKKKKKKKDETDPTKQLTYPGYGDSVGDGEKEKKEKKKKKDSDIAGLLTNVEETDDAKSTGSKTPKKKKKKSKTSDGSISESGFDTDGSKPATAKKKKRKKEGEGDTPYKSGAETEGTETGRDSDGSKSPVKKKKKAPKDASGSVSDAEGSGGERVKTPGKKKKKTKDNESASDDFHLPPLIGNGNDNTAPPSSPDKKKKPKKDKAKKNENSDTDVPPTVDGEERPKSKKKKKKKSDSEEDDKLVLPSINQKPNYFDESDSDSVATAGSSPIKQKKKKKPKSAEGEREAGSGSEGEEKKKKKSKKKKKKDSDAGFSSDDSGYPTSDSDGSIDSRGGTPKKKKKKSTKPSTAPASMSSSLFPLLEGQENEDADDHNPFPLPHEEAKKPKKKKKKPAVDSDVSGDESVLSTTSDGTAKKKKKKKSKENGTDEITDDGSKVKKKKKKDKSGEESGFSTGYDTGVDSTYSTDYHSDATDGTAKKKKKKKSKTGDGSLADGSSTPKKKKKSKGTKSDSQAEPNSSYPGATPSGYDDYNNYYDDSSYNQYTDRSNAHQSAYDATMDELSSTLGSMNM